MKWICYNVMEQHISLCRSWLAFGYIKDMNIVDNVTIMQLFIYPFLSRTFASPDYIVTKNILSYHYWNYEQLRNTLFSYNWQPCKWGKVFEYFTQEGSQIFFYLTMILYCIHSKRQFLLMINWMGRYDRLEAPLKSLES